VVAAPSSAPQVLRATLSIDPFPEAALTQ
jgi:hypothetical protein